jgi:hypothetical protein
MNLEVPGVVFGAHHLLSGVEAMRSEGLLGLDGVIAGNERLHVAEIGQTFPATD